MFRVGIGYSRFKDVIGLKKVLDIACLKICYWFRVGIGYSRFKYVIGLE